MPSLVNCVQYMLCTTYVVVLHREYTLDVYRMASVVTEVSH